MISEEIENAVDEVYQECVEQQFGLWITGLFFWFPEFTFDDQKAAFFILLRRLLDEGKVKFVRPDVDIYFVADQPPPKLTINDPETHWDVSTDEIITYLKEKWPDHATEANDPDLNFYFYEIPAIIWKGDDGKWYGS